MESWIIIGQIRNNHSNKLITPKNVILKIDSLALTIDKHIQLLIWPKAFHYFLQF